MLILHRNYLSNAHGLTQSCLRRTSPMYPTSFFHFGLETMTCHKKTGHLHHTSLGLHCCWKREWALQSRFVMLTCDKGPWRPSPRLGGCFSSGDE